MNPDDQSVSHWVRELKDGNRTAADQLWRACYERLVKFARWKLDQAPRRVADEEDVALSVFASFCQGVDRGQFEHLNDRSDLWQILFMLANRKAQHQLAKERRQKRGGGQVRGESVFANQTDGCAPGIEQFADQDFPRDFWETLDDVIEKAVAITDDYSFRSIAMLKLAGHSNAEIAKELDVSLRTVERRVQKIREVWEKTAAQEP